MLRLRDDVIPEEVARLLAWCPEDLNFFDLVSDQVGRGAESLLHATRPEADLATESLAADPGCDLERVFEATEAQRRQARALARQQIKAERKRQQTDARREGLRSLFEAAYASAAHWAENPSQTDRLYPLSERIIAIGQRIEADRLRTRLDGLPTPATPQTPQFLTLRVGVALLQLGRSNRSENVLGQLRRLNQHPELRDFYKWFGVLAEVLCGYARLPNGLFAAAELPMPVHDCTRQTQREAERALGQQWNSFVPADTSQVSETKPDGRRERQRREPALPVPSAPNASSPGASGEPFQDLCPAWPSTFREGSCASCGCVQEPTSDPDCFDGETGSEEAETTPSHPDGLEALHWLWWNT